MKIILASGSPRRKKLLEQIGMEFEIIPSKVDESRFGIDDPKELVVTLAIEKAKDVAARLKEGIVIGVDTVGLIDGEILGKPHTRENAIRMLEKLSGREHMVYSGLAVIDAGSGKMESALVETRVKFRELSRKIIEKYVDSENVLDKAAAYAIQEGAAAFVERIEGCYYNIVGLPLAKLSEILEKFSVTL